MFFTNIMRVLRFATFANILRVSSSALPNTKKLCRDCRHFIANEQQCRIFGDVNIVTGKELYDDARHARRDDNKCGELAKEFEENHYKIITVPYYFLKEYWAFSPLIAVFGCWIFIIMNLINKN